MEKIKINNEMNSVITGMTSVRRLSKAALYGQRAIELPLLQSLKFVQVNEGGSMHLEPVGFDLEGIYSFSRVADPIIVSQVFGLKEEPNYYFVQPTNRVTLQSAHTNDELEFYQKFVERNKFLTKGLNEQLAAHQESQASATLESIRLVRMEDDVRKIQNLDCVTEAEIISALELIRLLSGRLTREIPRMEQPFVTLSSDGNLALDLVAKRGRLLAAFVNPKTWNTMFIPNRGTAGVRAQATTEELANKLAEFLNKRM